MKQEAPTSIGRGSSRSFWNEAIFYDQNVKKLNRALYNDNLIYSPNILYFSENKLFYADTITCAAPNKSAAQQYQRVSDSECYDVMKSRIDHILYAAANHNVDTLILGAFGCGVFGNNPVKVAEIFKLLLTGKYDGFFQNVIFAVPKSKNGNYEAFYDCFKDCK